MHNNNSSMDQENLGPSPAPVHRPRGILGNQLPLLANSARGPNRATSADSGRQHKLKQRFTVIRKLGKGTYGKVQLAINKETGQEVAIKTIRKTKIENEQDLQRVRREIQIMSSIEHPHIIHIYEVFENKDKIVLVMQYAPGGELYEYVSKAKCLDDSEARRLFRQIATAIFYCHQNKICHRDLKLENILLDEKNNAKIADFGLSNVFDKSRQLKTFCGSPLYASPEIVQGSPYEGPEVDCWSLGVLLYTLVYGAMPFDGSNFKRLVKQISESTYFEPETRSNASPLIRRLLCADPMQRATILDICTDPWVNGQLVGAIPSSPSALRSSPNQNEAPQSASPVARHSLLKVAQDMAKLTPVRLDILLALAQQEPKTNVVADVAKPEEIHNNELNCEEDVRACSPVASYIVRDLDYETEVKPSTEKGEQKEQPDATKLQGASIEVEPNEVIEVELKPLETIAVAEEQVEPKLDEPLVATEDEPMLQDQIDQLETMQVEPEKNVEQVEIKMDVEAEPMAAEVPAQQPDADTASKLIEVSAVAAIEPKIEAPAAEEHGPAELTTTEESAKEPAEKQKKVKKKIVVVKKKKKVSKKVDAGGAEPPATCEPDKKPASDESAKQELGTIAPKLAESQRGPGKVKIPDTFKPSSGVIEQEQQPLKPESARRPSALIVDVSQKLLEQSVAKDTGSSSIIKTDQPQLASVRVSDKKDEFERRSSLAHSNGSPPSPKPQLPLSDEPAANAGENSQADQAKCEDDHSTTLTARGDKEEIDRKELESPTLEELKTPTSVKSTAVEPPSPTPLVDSPEPDNEPTVRSSFSISLGENPPEAGPKQLRQQLAPLKIPEPVESASIQLDKQHFTGQALIAAGPAPITRSYKKVTFTKDGACITETGRIYATKADDGTVRRVERKSKVTHYTTPSIASNTASSIGARPNQAVEPDWSPFERLIHPSVHGSDLFYQPQLDDPFRADSVFRNKSPFGTCAGQAVGQVAPSPHSPSCSSCSSGSTDALDDIFDQWTGAMSMFQRPINRRRHQRHLHSTGGSLAGTPRCGSAGGAVEHQDPLWCRQQPQRPGTATGGHHHHHRSRRSPRTAGWHDRSDTPSGYESDVPNERPASVLGSARGRTFGSSTLLQPFEPFREDGFGVESLEQSIERQHEALRHRLAQQHEQLWKGSTPSLFGAESSGTDDWRLPMPSLSSRRRQPPGGPLGQLLINKQRHSGHHLDDEQTVKQQTAGALSTKPPRAQRSSSGLQQHQPWPRESEPIPSSLRSSSQHNLEQSQSSSSFLRQSVPLDSAPNRQRPPNLPTSGTSVHRSTSRQTITSSSTANAGQKLHHQQVAKKQVSTSTSFIELKRTPSSQLAPPTSISSTVHERSEHQVKTESSKMFSSNTTALSTPSTSSLWPNPATPSTATAEPTLSHTPADNVDSRVQSWLQANSSAASQQLANSLSTSSGSKSSVSDLSRATTTTTGGSAFGPSAIQSQAAIHKESTVVVSTQSTQSMANTLSSLKQRIAEQAGSQITTFTTSLCQTEPSEFADSMFNQSSTRNLGMQRRLVHIASPSSSSSRLFQQPGSAPVRHHSLLGNVWQQVEERSNSSQHTPTEAIAFTGDSDGLGSPSTLDLELDSPSSSSLLNQLRSRGYRSMINQRIVSSSHSQQQIGEQEERSAVQVTRNEECSSAVQHHEIVTSSATSIHQSSTASQQQRSSSSRRVYTSSTSSSVTSGKIPKHQQQHVAVLDELSDEAQGTGDADKQQQRVPEADEHQKTDPDPELDEDVRDAKESIKAYVERMRETELFLKSVQEEEEKTERDRQQRFQFDNLLLSAKLNGIQSQIYRPTRLGADDPQTDPPASQDTGPRSAPIHQTIGSSWFPVGCQHQAPPSTYSVSASIHKPSSAMDGGFDWATWNSTRVVHKTSVGFYHDDGAEPFGYSAPSRRFNMGGSMQKLNSPSTFSWDYQPSSVFDTSLPYTTSSHINKPVRRDFRRCKSQLGDQFTSGDHRPLSMQLTATSAADCNQSDALHSWTAPVRAKRSVSQARYSSRLSQPATSEYRSSFVNHSPQVRSSNEFKFGESKVEDEDDDLGLSAYRVDAYIPRSRRELQVDDDESSCKPSRRISLAEMNASNEHVVTEQPGTSNRRSSLSTGGARTREQVQLSKVASTGEDKSRLQELERRLAENRRRREELLASNQSLNSSPGRSQLRPTARQAPTVETNGSGDVDDTRKPNADREQSCEAKSRQSSAGALHQPAPRFSSSNRPSRLESMEARIKRRSYCVRVCSPERPRSDRGGGGGVGGSLEQWQGARRFSSFSASATAPGGARGRSPSANN